MSHPPAVAGAPAAALNINVGVLGHVDCGKTSLVAALSTTLSTAALDKHPQSKERGITLDLGFSCFHVPTPPQLAHLGAPQLQFTLVDCPGHASLLRTIITGVQIIDMMMLVIDINKGVQAQTAECLVIGEITSDRLLVVLNKVDQLPEENRPKAIKKATKRLKEALASTRFATAPMVAVAAKPGGEGASSPPQGLQELTEALLQMVPSQPRAAEGPFLFAIDHCFPIKGQGTVLTGTCLQGRCNVGESIELPALKLKKQVKSAQVFKRPVQSIVAGDRAGICVTQLDAGLLERGLAAAPGSVPTFAAAIAQVDKIRFYPGEVHSKGTYHIIISHETVMAQVTFFGVPDGQGWPETEAVQQMVQSLSSLGISSTKQQGSSSDSGAPPSQPLTFDWAAQYPYQEQLYGLEGRPAGAAAAAVPGGSHEATAHHGPQWALLRFAQPVTAPQASLIIGAKLDTDPHGKACRLAFYGRLVALLYAGDMEGPGCRLQKLRVYKEKTKEGSIERILPDGCTAICKGMFKKETDLSVFEGLQVRTGAGEVGCIEGRFGSSGKVRVGFTAALTAPRAPQDNRITLSYKRYVFDESSSRHRLQQ